MAKILMVIAPQRFRDEELFVTQAELERAGHEIVIASTTAGECSGSRGGARYCGPGVTVDGRMITANAPKASRLFAEKIIEVIES